MASTSLLDRLSSNHRSRSPILPLNRATSRSPSEYQMDQLSPRPDGASSAPSDDSLPRAWMDEPDEIGTRRRSPEASWRARDRSSESPSMKKPWNMFSGPPPPISASMVRRKNHTRKSQSESLGRSGNSALQSPVRAIVPIARSVLFEARPEPAHPRPDSRWRGFRRQEKALEQEIQKLLDYQAAALMAGSGGIGDAMGADPEVRSDGSITPTGTLYSTKSSKHGMTSSLYVPTRATADGDVIPVRQPTKERPLGLRATRAGLQKSITAMARLKQDEGAHLEDALAQRRHALQYLGDLSARRADIDTELEVLDQGGEEPLGQELRELAEKQNTLDREIQRLEENLAAMRTRRRWLSQRMDDIRNKREAGLSGYRGALKEVDAEVTALMRRPPIQPLDPDISSTRGAPTSSTQESSGGTEFMQLHPERRTLEMAKSWWESEAAALEARKRRIDADRQALEEGGVVWDLVMQLVSDFESSLRKVMQLPSAGPSPDSPSSSSSSSHVPRTKLPPGPSSSALIKKTREKTPSQEETIRDQLPQMRNVLEELERHMALAQEKRWNLLICAIGAELEAFRQAFDMLEALVGPAGRGGKQGLLPLERGDGDREEAEEADNEVPRDLLGVPPSESSQEHEHEHEPEHEHEALRRDLNSVPLPRSGSDSENEVPLEFLAEHVPQ